MSDPISQMLRQVIWRKRTEYLNEAVARKIITPDQAEALHLLRLEIDDRIDQADGDG